MLVKVVIDPFKRSNRMVLSIQLKNSQCISYLITNWVMSVCLVEISSC
uniref:Uncharacterized protein n=1 Tax=Arundo donax TaxID=35708 RepID=A0A0A8YU51_ARUDO